MFGRGQKVGLCFLLNAVDLYDDDAFVRIEISLTAYLFYVTVVWQQTFKQA